MTQIKIRIKIGEGVRGVPINKLAEVSGGWERFLRFLSEDSGITIQKGQWIATNFEESSLAFTAEPISKVKETETARFRDNYNYVTDYDPIHPIKPCPVRYETLVQYARLIEPLEAHESLTKTQANNIINEIETGVEYYGTIHGVIHAFFKGADPPYFTIREHWSNDLIKCFFQVDLYKNVYVTLEKRDALVYTHGSINANKNTKKIEQIWVDKIVAAPELSRKEFDKFFGSAPNYTGSLSSQEAIDKFWNDEE